MEPKRGLEIVARDGAARIGTLRLDGAAELPLPGILYVDTDRFPAPSWASHLLAAREPAGTRAWVFDQGSRFRPRTLPEFRKPPFLNLAPDLPYSPGSGDILLAAGNVENGKHVAEGRDVTGAQETSALGGASRGASVATVLLAPRPSAPLAQPTTGGAIVPVGAMRALFDNPYAFARTFSRLRAELAPEAALYAPGVGLPHELALLAYAGVDIVDTASTLLAARGGVYLTPEGPLSPSALAGEPPCSCPACVRLDFGQNGLVEHALVAQRQEMARVRAAVRAGRLRELVEQRIRSQPFLSAHLRRFDRECYDFFEERVPLSRDDRLFATSIESQTRPEIERWRRRLEERYLRPPSARVLVVLPCSARKPYSRSKTHRILETALGRVPNRATVHEVILTSPLGLVPRELEGVYPASKYDLPVTGHWDAPETAMIRDTVSGFLERNSYDAIVVHLEEVEMEIVAPVLAEFAWTCSGDALSPASLDQLRSRLAAAAQAVPKADAWRREWEDFLSIARWQFGAQTAEVLLQGTKIRGRPPFQKVFAEDGAQVAMRTERGLLALAAEGGRRLLEASAYQVAIDDFRPHGTIFSVGVRDADPRIRIGDEVVVHHAGDFRGVGRALVPGPEMVSNARVGAVSIRHALRAGPAPSPPAIAAEDGEDRGV